MHLPSPLRKGQLPSSGNSTRVRPDARHAFQASHASPKVTCGVSRQTEAAAIRRTHTKTLRAGNTPGAFLQQPAHRR